MKEIMNSNNKPAFDIFVVREGSNKKSYFTKIGAAWPTKSGTGYSFRSLTVEEFDALDAFGQAAKAFRNLAIQILMCCGNSGQISDDWRTAGVVGK
jgi:hypothetical protein